MELHDLKSPKGSRKKKNIVGRGKGSGNGKTAGRGENGQGSRTGRTGSYIAFEGGQSRLIRRLPKVGFNNPNPTVYEVVKLSHLDKFENGTTVDVAVLKEAGVLSSTKKEFKVLNSGKLTKKLTVRADAFSKSAAEQIQKAGGTAEVVKTIKREAKAGDTQKA